ncbi:MAG TPA: acetyl-CoA carboxylase carboxyltransferase subunit alpha [Candidatus Saccharimonadales bacterium]|nr:acetyl-CoA carboxylase carboxyltransferase subunit alpha [Candidatus Saccharimonadales bacterium]
MLDFEKPLAELETQIERLRGLAEGQNLEIQGELQRLERKLNRTRVEVFARLTPWQRVQLARHLGRPTTLDYVGVLCEESLELAGDRNFRDDPGLVAGLGLADGVPLVWMGHQKGGGEVKENVRRNFGMAHPEGYRKALRMFDLAHRFHLPVVSIVDTPGAFPGVGAEERGISEAIARNLREMLNMEAPFVAVITGEGGSGGALGIAVADVVLVLEYAFYSVISPEGCASILWSDSSKAAVAAEALRFTSGDLVELRVVDEVIPEPPGGAHRDPALMKARVREAVLRHVRRLRQMPPPELVRRRREKYLAMGVVAEDPSALTGARDA